MTPGYCFDLRLVAPDCQVDEQGSNSNQVDEQPIAFIFSVPGVYSFPWYNQTSDGETEVNDNNGCNTISTDLYELLVKAIFGCGDQCHRQCALKANLGVLFCPCVSVCVCARLHFLAAEDHHRPQLCEWKQDMELCGVQRAFRLFQRGRNRHCCNSTVEFSRQLFSTKVAPIPRTRRRCCWLRCCVASTTSPLKSRATFTSVYTYSNMHSLSELSFARFVSKLF